MKPTRAVGLCMLAGMILMLTVSRSPCQAETGREDRGSEWPFGKDVARTSKATTTTERQAARLAKYYVALYRQRMHTYNWIVRAMAIIDLARMDHPTVTSFLLEVLEGNTRGAQKPTGEAGKATPKTKPSGRTETSSGGGLSSGSRYTMSDIIVRLYAYEALYARLRSLTPAQLQRWWKVAKYLAAKNMLHGDMRIAFLRVLAELGPSAEHKRYFIAFFLRTDATNPADIYTLRAMRDVLARWKSPDLVKSLIRGMSRLSTFYRSEYVLRGLRSNPYDWRKDIPEGSNDMQNRTMADWAKWFKSANLTEAEAKTEIPVEAVLIAVGRGSSGARLVRGKWQDQGTGWRDDSPPKGRRRTPGAALLAGGEKLTDPQDPKWRKNLELPQLQLRQLEVTFVVDATGSMTEVVDWIKNDVLKMATAFGLISMEPRVGVVFFKDFGDTFTVAKFKMTGSAKSLAKSIQGISARGGADLPEAVYEGLKVALTQQRWSTSSFAKRVVILVGDAPPHEKTIQNLERLIRKYGQRNLWSFYTIKVPTPRGAQSLPSFDNIADWGGGKTMVVRFPVPNWDARTRGTAASHDRQDNKFWREERARIADPPMADGPRRIAREVVHDLLTDTYKDRTEPFVDVLMEIVEAPFPEKREPFISEKAEAEQKAYAQAEKQARAAKNKGGGGKKGGKKKGGGGKKGGKKKGGGGGGGGPSRDQ